MILKEMFIPKRRIPIKNHRLKNRYLKMFNDKVAIYESIYTYTDKCDAFHVNIDKIFLDFDYDENLKFLDDIRTVAKYLYEQNIKFYIRFSGRGFHLFILITDDWLDNPKYAIKQFVKELHKKTNTKSDMMVVGDLRRVSRMPYTLNKKSNLYCMSLKYEDLMEKTYEEICKMAEAPIFIYDYIYGEKYLDITEYDNSFTPTPTAYHVTTGETKITNEILPCIKNLMKDPYTLYRGRFLIIMFFKEMGYTEEEVEMILKDCLCEEYYEHCVDEEKQISYLFARDELSFPNCESIKIDGYCPDQKCKGHCLYY